MKSLFFKTAFILVYSLQGFAHTKGIERLHMYDCDISSRNGEIEQHNPIAKTILAQNKDQAVALYLIHLNANMANEKVVIVDAENVHSPGTYITDDLLEVRCDLENKK